MRELKNFVQRACILADSVIESTEPPEAAPALAAEDQSGLVVIRVGTPLNEVDRRVTMATLEQCKQVKRTAARVLGISLKTLYNRLDVYAAAEKARGVENSERAP